MSESMIFINMKNQNNAEYWTIQIPFFDEIHSNETFFQFWY